MCYSGKIIVLAFPDTFVCHSDEKWCKLLPFLGLGTRTHIKAGHAAQILINNATGEMRYFDFGRYVTPLGMGRVRGHNTDAELLIPFAAKIVEDELVNLDEVLLWLARHPEKTHGKGRLLASVCHQINFEDAITFINDLQQQGSVPYKAFGKLGSNCARFVADTILASTDCNLIKKSLLRNKKFTPSTVGNVEKAGGKIYQVLDGKISLFNSTALKENLTNYFDKRISRFSLEKSKVSTVDNAQCLSGIGSSAFFKVESFQGQEAVIVRYNEEGQVDFRGVFVIDLDMNTLSRKQNLDFSKPYRFVYDSHCAQCTISQDNVLYVLKKEVDLKLNSARRSHSA